jgi:hypothetical protein
MRSAIATSAASAPAASLIELRGEVAPHWLGPAICRQVPDQCAHVGERFERHDIGDDERLR